GVLGDEAIDHHGSILADAVGAIRRLVFHRGVPPRVEQKHVIGRGEVQAGAARLERDEEHGRPRRVLELGDDGGPVARRAVEARAAGGPSPARAAAGGGRGGGAPGVLGSGAGGGPAAGAGLRGGGRGRPAGGGCGATRGTRSPPCEKTPPLGPPNPAPPRARK